MKFYIQVCEQTKSSKNISTFRLIVGRIAWASLNVTQIFSTHRSIKRCTSNASKCLCTTRKQNPYCSYNNKALFRHFCWIQFMFEVPNFSGINDKLLLKIPLLLISKLVSALTEKEKKTSWINTCEAFWSLYIENTTNIDIHF